MEEQTTMDAMARDPSKCEIRLVDGSNLAWCMETGAAACCHAQAFGTGFFCRLYLQREIAKRASQDHRTSHPGRE